MLIARLDQPSGVDLEAINVRLRAQTSHALCTMMTQEETTRVRIPPPAAARGHHHPPAEVKFALGRPFRARLLQLETSIVSS